MPDLNSVALTGTIALEPKLIERGTLTVARLRLEVETLRRNRGTGELSPRLHHFTVAVFGGHATEAARLRVGTRVGVRGQLSHSTFRDPEGAERESVEVTTAEWVRPLEVTADGPAKSTPPKAGPASSRESSRLRQPTPGVLDW